MVKFSNPSLIEICSDALKYNSHGCTLSFLPCSLRTVLPTEQVELLRLLRQHMSHSVQQSAYNWIRPSLWTSLFGKSAAAASGEIIGSKF